MKINQQELNKRLIKTEHLIIEDNERLNNAFVVIYGDTNTVFVYDGNGMTEQDRIELIEYLTTSIQVCTNFKRTIIAQSNNIYFVY